MEIDLLEWDDANMEHIALHGVNPEEVWDICSGHHLAVKQANGRYILSGQTSSGRYLNVVVQHLVAVSFRPVTAFDMSDSQKRSFRKRFQNRGSL